MQRQCLDCALYSNQELSPDPELLNSMDKSFDDGNRRNDDACGEMMTSSVGGLTLILTFLLILDFQMLVPNRQPDFDTHHRHHRV